MTNPVTKETLELDIVFNQSSLDDLKKVSEETAKEILKNCNVKILLNDC